MDIYREHIIEHAKNPSNFKPLTEYTHVGSGEHALCGDELSVQLNVRNDVIQEIGFQGHGCAICMASASILSEEIMGKSVAAVQSMTKDDLLGELGIPLSPNRMKCALLSLETVHNALFPKS